MPDQRTTRNQLVTEGSAQYTVIAVSFEDHAKAYEALSTLKELDAQQRVGLQEAVVAVRREDGRAIEKDRVESTFLPYTIGGGLLGLLMGVIGGPLGIMIGGTTGLLAGALFDIDESDETESALGSISGSIGVGQTALLAVVAEQSTEVIDTAMSELGGTMVRRSLDDVEAEIAAADHAERQAKREANRQLLRARQDRDIAAVRSKVENLKAKLHPARSSKTPSTESLASAQWGSRRRMSIQANEER